MIVVLSYTAGPTVEPTMRVSILLSRDTDPNIVFTISFNVTFGSPSRIYCVYTRIGQTTKVAFFNVRNDHPNLSREVIRSQYVSSSQSDMTRVTVKVDLPIREERTYLCEVIVEGRRNIVSGIYAHDTIGSAVTNVTITGKRSLTYCIPLALLSPPPLSCRHPYWCHCQQDWLHLCPGLLDCPITTTSWL